MSSRRTVFLLASLVSAVSCADAGNPTGSEPPVVPHPVSTPGNVLQAFTCSVDVRADKIDCLPMGLPGGGAVAVINIGAGSSGTHLQLTSSNSVRTPTSHTFDLTIKNNMVGQIVGTTDGTTAHPYGMKAYYFDPANPTVVQPTVLVKTNPALPASITMNGDASQKFTGAGSAVRPYFQYAPQILLPGETSTAKTWSFTLDNVDTYRLIIYVSTEVRWPKGWLELIPGAPVMQTGSDETLIAQVRGAFGQRIVEGVNWNSSDPAVLTVTELAADSLAQATAVAPGTAWVRAVSAVDPVNRRDSVLVTVN